MLVAVQHELLVSSLFTVTLRAFSFERFNKMEYILDQYVFSP